VLLEVVQHVDERVSNFSWRLQRARMIALGPYASVPPEDAVDRLRSAHRKALYAAREPRRRIRLRDQMEMIGLNTELKDSEAIAGGRAERALEAAEDPRYAQ
jgi:hypothetical protein